MKYLFTVLISLFVTSIFGQISGKVNNKDGEPLPFASIYVENTSRGTTTNAEGKYSLDLKDGNYTIVFQYVGYQRFIKKITLKNTLVLDISLEDISTEMKEVVIKANAEDPAYAVIREAIAKRTFYQKLIKSYSCEVYIKGVQKMLTAPKKLMGRDLGDFGGALDSNRQGIVYLSESLAKYYFAQPNQKKEVMISSKVSGRSNGFSFNQASAMDFSFYDNYIEIQRQILSPIAENALNYYRYKLLGTFYDNDGKLINKIEVTPKRKEDPTFAGIIYIIENQWNIQSTDLYVTGKSIKQDALDTLWIRQVHVPLEGDKWRLFSQKIDFKFGLLGFKLAGNFTGVFTNYDLHFEAEKGFFNSESFKVERDANEKDSTYWNNIRPVPLTKEENKDYTKKDSLQIVRKSKSYLDSLDKVRNKFTFSSAVFGYTFSNSYKKWSVNIPSPIFATQFNAVQGFHVTLGAIYKKRFDDINARWFEIAPSADYGFVDERFREKLRTTFHFNRLNDKELSLELGNKNVTQFNEENPLSPTLNSYYNLIGKKNFLRVFEKTYAKISFQQEIINGVFLKAETEYARRAALENHTNYSWLKRDKVYEANNLQNADNQLIDFQPHEAYIVELGLRLRYKQEYLSYPDRKFIRGSSLPDLWVRYRKGIPVGHSLVDFDKISVEISQDEIAAGIWGYSEFEVEAGTFINQKKLPFNDWNHFNGMPFLYGNRRYLSSFLLMNNYQYSTKAAYGLAHWQHHFQGYFLDKIPIINRLGWKEVIGASTLQTGERKNYTELNVGLENIGFGVFRLLRVDFMYSLENGKASRKGLVFTLNL